jgi:hypothetical protein
MTLVMWMDGAGQVSRVCESCRCTENPACCPQKKQRERIQRVSGEDKVKWPHRPCEAVSCRRKRPEELFRRPIQSIHVHAATHQAEWWQQFSARPHLNLIFFKGVQSQFHVECSKDFVIYMDFPWFISCSSRLVAEHFQWSAVNLSDNREVFSPFVPGRCFISLEQDFDHLFLIFLKNNRFTRN